jgi:hypothetical protein
MTDFFTPKKKASSDIWYKEPWMLLVVGGPVVVVIAAIITGFIAWQGEDKVIAKDYYKHGLNINKDIFRDAKANEYKMQGKAKLDSVTGKILLQLEGKTTLPSSVIFSTSFTSSNSVYEQIQKISLTQVQPGIYEGELKMPSATDSVSLALWHVQIEATDWRLTADWHDPMHSSLQLQATN